MGNPDAFDASSAEEILDDIVESIRYKESHKLKEEIDEHTKTKDQLPEEQERIGRIESSLDRKSERIAKQIGRFIFGLVTILIAFGIYANRFPESFELNKTFKNYFVVRHRDSHSTEPSNWL